MNKSIWVRDNTKLRVAKFENGAVVIRTFDREEDVTSEYSVSQVEMVRKELIAKNS